MRTITKYMAFDGTEFFSESACRSYEEEHKAKTLEDCYSAYCEYCKSEFETEETEPYNAEYDVTEHYGLMFTEAYSEKEESKDFPVEIQLSVCFAELKEYYYADGELIFVEDFSNYDELYLEMTRTSFDDFYSAVLHRAQDYLGDDTLG